MREDFSQSLDIGDSLKKRKEADDIMAKKKKPKSEEKEPEADEDFDEDFDEDEDFEGPDIKSYVFWAVILILIVLFLIWIFTDWKFCVQF